MNDRDHREKSWSLCCCPDEPPIDLVHHVLQDCQVPVSNCIDLISLRDFLGSISSWVAL